MLTPENLDTFLEAIPLESLPQTFRDALYIARNLGLEHLWIDALCILQKQTANTDWVHEAARMRSVYGGAHVNLAASSATSVDGGCFLKPEYHNGGFCARVTTTGANAYSAVRNFHSSEVYEESSTGTHLASRAWSLQEKLLPPRTLFFGNQGLFWECRTKIASEFLPDGFPGKLGSHLVQAEDKAWNWGEIVRHYSGAALTFGTDRLPALSGIATRQREATGDDYLAGMWRRDLVMQLSWALLSPQHRKKRPAWRAPSWSWASVDGQTSFWSYWNHDGLVNSAMKYVYVLDSWTTKAGPDPCGAVVGGELSIGCSTLLRGRIQQKHESRDTTSSPQKFEPSKVLLESGTLPIPITIDYLDDETSTGDDDFVYLLPVFSGESGLGSVRVRQSGQSNGTGQDFEDLEHVNQLMNRGLVLSPCGVGKGRFRRIGSFDLRFHPSPDEFLGGDRRKYYHELMRIIGVLGSSMAEAECSRVLLNPDNPEARFIITIE